MNNPIPQIIDALKSAKRLLIVTHVFPDGDNIGSGLALYMALKAIGKDVSFYLHGDVPRTYSWLPASDEIQGMLPEKNDPPWTILAIDSGDLGRMGEPFEEWYDAGLTTINVDHHVSNVYFGDISWVDPDYSSVGEMVIEILDALGAEITPEIATCIFCAVYTDTGRFGYSNTNSRSIRVAARCVEAGANPHQTYARVYSSRTLSGLRLFQMAMGTLRFFAGNTGAAFHIDSGMFSDTGTVAADTENFMESVTQVGKLKIVVLFKEVEPGVIKASLRCREPIDAFALAAKFDGGGHPRASGFTFLGTIEEAYEKFLAEAEKALAAVGCL